MKKAKNEFVSNLIGLGSVNVLNLIIPIITMPILSRALGGDGYGIVLLFSSVTIFMMIIVDYSVNINGVRDVALNPNSLESIYIRFQGVRC
ncbi:TPA: oligosaccharide flippase family protein, partial [Escherichia coli]|nr:oligosaccharide flippase family protein [Escherichia coli]